MANFFSSIGKMFGFTKDKQPAEAQTVNPYLQEKPASLKTYEKTIADRLAGLGVGFDKDYLSSASTPYATSTRYGLKTQTLPQISQKASGVGLSRSTIPVSIGARASQEAEMSIAEKMAQIEAANQEQKRLEINEALRNQGIIGTGDLAEQKAYYDWQNNKNITNRAEATNFSQAADQRQQAGASRALALAAAGIAAPFTGGASLASIPSILASGSGSVDNNTQNAIIDEILKRRNATNVNVGNILPNSATAGSINLRGW